MTIRALLILVSFLIAAETFADAAANLSKVIQAQQASYRQGDWQEFFGRSRFYRSRGDYSAKLVALEISALAKHCLWNEAETLLAWGLERYPGVELEMARDHLRLRRQFPTELTAQGRGDVPSSAFSSQVFWPVTSKAVGQVDDAERVRVVVASQCGEEQ